MSLPSILRSAGTSPPASFTSVGSTSISLIGASQAVPAAILPGHQAIVGSRMPPSQVRALAAAQRAGDAAVRALGEPRAVVAGEEHQRAFGELQFAQRVEHAADAPVHFLDPVAVACRWPTCPETPCRDGAAHARRCAAGRGRTAGPCWP